MVRSVRLSRRLFLFGAVAAVAGARVAGATCPRWKFDMDYEEMDSKLRPLRPVWKLHRAGISVRGHLVRSPAWHRCRLRELRKGDTFKMNMDGSEQVFRAGKDPGVRPDGVWYIDSIPMEV